MQSNANKEKTEASKERTGPETNSIRILLPTFAWLVPGLQLTDNAGEDGRFSEEMERYCIYSDRK